MTGLDTGWSCLGWHPPDDATPWDCERCGDGFWLTPEQAAAGCPNDYPAPCGALLRNRATL